MLLLRTYVTNLAIVLWLPFQHSPPVLEFIKGHDSEIRTCADLKTTIVPHLSLRSVPHVVKNERVDSDGRSWSHALKQHIDVYSRHAHPSYIPTSGDRYDQTDPAMLGMILPEIT